MTQSTRQEARRRAQEQLQRRREEFAAREARIRDLAIDTSAAWLEQQRVIAETEQRIGAKLHALVAEENVSVTEAAQLCGMEVREVNRLRRNHSPSQEPSRDQSPAI